MSRDTSAEEFEELYRATVHHLIVYMRRRGSTDPENDVAEVYAIAWRRRADLPGPMLRRAWLFGVAAKLLQADHRRTTREAGATAELARHAPSSPVTDDPSSSVVAAAMERLTPGDREILRLVEWERLTPAELATALGVRPGAARVRLHRARMALARDPAVRALVEPVPNEMALGGPVLEPERSE